MHDMIICCCSAEDDDDDDLAAPAHGNINLWLQLFWYNSVWELMNVHYTSDIYCLCATHQISDILSTNTLTHLPLHTSSLEK